MSEAPFNEPRLALNRIYTKRGDSGDTSLVGGQRSPKDALRIECYGTLDELNSFVGMACFASQQRPELAELSTILQRVQHELFNLGSILATLPEDIHPRQPQITATDVEQLEREIDMMNEGLPVAAIVCTARRVGDQFSSPRVPHGLPEGGTAMRHVSSEGVGAAVLCAVPESIKRCFFRVEPLGKRATRRRRSPVATE